MGKGLLQGLYMALLLRLASCSPTSAMLRRGLVQCYETSNMTSTSSTCLARGGVCLSYQAAEGQASEWMAIKACGSTVDCKKLKQDSMGADSTIRDVRCCTASLCNNAGDEVIVGPARSSRGPPNDTLVGPAAEGVMLGGQKEAASETATSSLACYTTELDGTSYATECLGVGRGDRCALYYTKCAYGDWRRCTSADIEHGVWKPVQKCATADSCDYLNELTRLENPLAANVTCCFTPLCNAVPKMSTSSGSI